MRILFTTLLMAATLTAGAQLRVTTNGNVAIKSSQTPLSPLTLGGSGDSTYFVHYNGSLNGVHAHSHNTGRLWNIGGHFSSEVPSGHFAVGVKGEVTTPLALDDDRYGYLLDCTYGVMGIAGHGNHGYNYGVFGRIDGGQDGAAVYGSAVAGDLGTGVDGRLAGYFNGEVRISGNTEIWANLDIDGSLGGMLLDDIYVKVYGARTRGTSAAGRHDGAEQTDVIRRLSGLTALSYYREQPANGRSTTRGAALERPKSFIGQQRDAKLHYALPGDQLEEMFPELVYEREDGSKAVNYVEMIPLLVQAINELSAEVEELRGARTRGADADDETLSRRDTPSATLCQNTPNPFTERTEIRFTLPDNTHDACICIFDMTGKMLRQIPVDATKQSVTINGYELSAGIYLYSLVVGGQEIDTKRMILSK